MKQTLYFLLGGALALLLSLPLGCAARIDLEREGLLLGEVSTRTMAPLTPAQLIPWLESPEPSSVRFDVVAGKNKGEILIEDIERLGDNQWTIELRLERDDVVLEKRPLSLRSDGAVVLGPITKHDRGLTVEMTPAPVVMPPEFLMGQPIRSLMSMRLPTLANPEILRGQGTGVMELTLLGTQRVIYAGKPHRAWLIREVFTTDLGISSVRRVADRWYVPEVGLVLEKWEERVKALGLVIERSSRAMRRIAEPGQ